MAKEGVIVFLRPETKVQLEQLAAAAGVRPGTLAGQLLEQRLDQRRERLEAVIGSGVSR